MKTQSLPVVILVLSFGLQAGAQEKSWKGEIVMPTKPAKDITFVDMADSKPVDFTGRPVLTVRDERDGRILLHDGNREGWADKSQFVLARDAPDYFRRLVQADPNDTWSHYMRGSAWNAMGEPDKAINDFDECLRLDPSHSAAYSARGNAWSEKKEYDRAIRDYDVAIRHDPRDALTLNNRGNAWSNLKAYDKAIRDFDKAIQLDPKLAHAFSSRGAVWSKKKEYGKAIQDYNEAIRLDPGLAYPYINRGAARHFRKEYDKALEDYNEAIHLNPTDAVAYYNRGMAWHDMIQYDRAIKDYDEAIRLDPKYAVAFGGRGNAWSDKKEYDKAIKDFNEAIRLDPKNARAFNNRGNAWSAKKGYDRAIKDFNEAIRLNPKEALAYFNRAVAQLLDQRPETEEGFRALLDLQGWKGEYSVYAVILGHLAARQNRDEAAATRWLKESTGKLDKVWPFPVLQYLNGELDETSVLKLATDDDRRTEARCYLGIAQLLKGRRNEALAHFRWVKKHGNNGFIEYRIAVAELEQLEK
jgi:tetratricopeptide (TPR) repeat protein